MSFGDYVRNGVNFVSGGYLDRQKANEIKENADWERESTIDELEISKEETNQNILELGSLKQNVYQQSITDFIKHYEIIGKVDLKPIKENKVLNYENFQTDLAEMKVVTATLKELGTVVGGGALIGASAAFGAMGTAALIGTASTGTAIGTLSGAAATNATLAWLGGGAISAGGLGVTGGMVVLGGIALAPVALFGMFLGANKGKEILNEAYNYHDEIQVMIEKMMTLIAELSQIRRGCDLMSKSIQGLDALLKRYNLEMGKIVYRLEHRSILSKNIIDPIKNKIFNISILTDKEAMIFATAANISAMLSEIIRMPLMNQEGAFINQSLEELEKMQPQVELLIHQQKVSDL